LDVRHLGSLLLGLIIAPLLWILTGIGVVRLNEGIAREAFGQSALGFVLLAVAGLLAAALLVPRISPVGPAIVGLGYLAVTAWAVLGFGSLVDLLPRSFLGTEFALTAPLGETSVLLAITMLATLLNPHRWRSPRPAGTGSAAGRPGYPSFPAPGSAGGAGTPFPPGGQPSAPGQYGTGGTPAYPPNFGPAATPSHSPTAPPNFGPAAYGPATPTPNAPAATPYPTPAGTPAGLPGQPTSAPGSTPPIPAPLPPAFAPPAPRQATAENSTGAAPTVTSYADETTSFAGRPDDGTEEATRRLGDR